MVMLSFIRQKMHSIRIQQKKSDSEYQKLGVANGEYQKLGVLNELNVHLLD